MRINWNAHEFGAAICALPGASGTRSHWSIEGKPMPGRICVKVNNEDGSRVGLSVELELSMAHECVMSLAVFSDTARRSEYEIGSSWFDEIQTHASSDLLEMLERFTFRTHQIWEHVVALIYACPAPRDVPTMLRFLEQMDPLQLRLHLIGYYDRENRRLTSPEVIFQAAQGDLVAQRSLLATSLPEDVEWQQ